MISYFLSSLWVTFLIFYLFLAIPAIHRMIHDFFRYTLTGRPFSITAGKNVWNLSSQIIIYYEEIEKVIFRRVISPSQRRRGQISMFLVKKREALMRCHHLLRRILKKSFFVGWLVPVRGDEAKYRCFWQRRQTNRLTTRHLLEDLRIFIKIFKIWTDKFKG